MEPDKKYIVSLTRKDGSSLAFYNTFENLEAKINETVADTKIEDTKKE